MKKMDAEAKAMSFLADLTPGVREQVLSQAVARWGVRIQFNIQAAPSPRVANGEAHKAKPRKLRAVKTKTVSAERGASRRLVYEAIKSVSKDGKTTRAALSTHLREKNAPGGVVSNLNNYLTTLQRNGMVKRSGTEITLIQG